MNSDTSSLLKQKEELRRELRRSRQQFSKTADAAARGALITQLLKLWPETDSTLWCTYRALPEEADPQEAVSLRPRMRWAYPRVEGSSLRFFIPRKGASWEPSPLGVLEPEVHESEEIQLSQAQGVLVPGLGFDKNGNRLGFGRGFYDRALTGFSGLKVGVAWSVQILQEELRSESWDIPMDLIATERSLVRVARKER